ncbi:NifB/NifX family molybdenum-iron cluster-binding protein [Caldicoprobacter algeriensis]|uniref:NifB/NifX family molybdenum-iron cluster-binding protein n=1 Tax=Caldicoprobacter algeriensis TaxID=699281 RepID=UPI00207A28A2|nr:NifB/NifX family molybdenum-iron cluster-binding protein [Caldicoprobacter algeriensis]MCM8900246.1 NifB/NifX family molybdenum-iron cluster-binding protein [Caldicoprobacter algeriensis]
MRYAISADQGYVSPHFGRCEKYVLIDIENRKVTTSRVIDNPGHSPGFIPRFLHDQGVNCILCGGIGKQAIQLLEEYGIDVITGVEGSVEEVIQKLLAGTLKGGASFCHHE